MTLSDLYTLSITKQFQNSVKMAMLFAAENVASEAVSSNVIVDAKRQALAQDVLNDGGGNKLMAFVNTCAAFGTLTLQSPDGDIQFVVNSLWDSLAGVTPADKVLK